MSSPEEKVSASISEEPEESGNDAKKPEPNPMLAEEAKLKAKYPNMGRPSAGHSAFLQKRLQKGQKYFDSGDYQMAKQRGPLSMMRGSQMRGAPPTGETIPTPETLPSRKTSLVQNNKTPLT
ncbi:cAMP-regulated phosphoprotein 19-like [Amphibalanus amphitrite]|uniref:cAMP-regulated phosphoprotein 19-like n=1 Tax=Amphibalanus amphitrite TaxID=1232801 RepID=UPI001C910C41|nr:cAMP-regulated phosphoprotein 19-like [Amphibalanus amphitrite]XP_043219116.1 cAMP-regulated phosphoprotein 19-like [Amphibalanus amphitrite]